MTGNVSKTATAENQNFFPRDNLAAGREPVDMLSLPMAGPCH
jgi:hypothetical protein